MVRVREISESLVLIGDPISLHNLIENVLDELPEEYDSIVADINSKEELSSLDELESWLLAHESRLEKHHKVFVTKPAMLNLAQVAPLSTTVAIDQSGTDVFPQGTSYVVANAENHGYSSCGGRFGRGGGRYGCGGGRFDKTQCQICHKYGHDASICYYRYSNSSGAAYPPQRAPYSPFLMPARPMFQPSFGYGALRATPPRAAAPQAFFAGSEANFNNQWWYPDSSASHHVTPEASDLSDSISLPGSEQVFM